MIDNLEYFVLLLPGFFIYVTLARFLRTTEERNSLETVFHSLILSIFVMAIVGYLSQNGILTIDIMDWRFSVSILIIYIVLTTVLIVFFKRTFPWIEKKTQLFDSVKSSTKDILYDIFYDKVNSSKEPVWIHILTKDNISYTGNLFMQGLTKDKKEAVYIKKPKITNKNPPINIDPLEGMFIKLEDIKWFGIINTNYGKERKRITKKLK